jgi:hypothetical protein
MRFSATNSTLASWLCSALILSAADTPSKVPAVPSREDLLAWDRVEKARADAKKDPKKRSITLPEQDIEGWARTQDFFTHGKGKFTDRRWKNQHLDQPAIQQYPVVEVERFANDPVPEPQKPKWAVNVHLRQSYSDVLSIEDPTQSINPNKRYEDLKGALLSYTRDYKADTDTWSAQAAVLFPIVRTTGRGDNPREWTTLAYGAIPSISVYRVDTNGDPANEVDQLNYRLELYGKYSSPWWPLETITLRAFGLCVTDTGHDSAIPTAQFELEPQMFFFPHLAIGYHQSLIRGPWRDKIAGVSDYFAQDNTLLGYQLRFRLHGEFGEVVNSGATGLPEESFLRGGPMIDLTLSPIITDRLKLTLSYSYLPSAFGPNEHNDLFSATMELIVVKSADSQRTLSLKGIYTKGGIDVTKEKVDTLQFGMAATF